MRVLGVEPVVGRGDNMDGAGEMIRLNSCCLNLKCVMFSIVVAIASFAGGKPSGGSLKISMNWYLNIANIVPKSMMKESVSISTILLHWATTFGVFESW